MADPFFGPLRLCTEADLARMAGERTPAVIPRGHEIEAEAGRILTRAKQRRRRWWWR